VPPLSVPRIAPGVGRVCGPPLVSAANLQCCANARPHTPVFVYEPQQTPDADFDTLGRFKLHFIATDGSSVFVRMNKDMLKSLRDQIAKAVPRTVRFVPVPTTIVAIEPNWRGYDYFMVADQIVICGPNFYGDRRNYRRVI
jgi:hypothetical protein